MEYTRNFLYRHTKDRAQEREEKGKKLARVDLTEEAVGNAATAGQRNRVDARKKTKVTAPTPAERNPGKTTTGKETKTKAQKDKEAKSSTSSHMAIKRLSNELMNLQRNGDGEGFSANLVSEDNLFLWEAIIFGPDDTPLEGGLYTLRIEVPQEYPQKPPRVRFLTPMFHPNVFKDGQICLDILREKHWRPSLDLTAIIVGIQSLLADPGLHYTPAGAANAEAERLYINDRAAYNARVRRMLDN